MIIDKLLQVSNKQAVSATAASTDTIDTGAANSAIGDVTSLAMVFSFSVAGTGAGTVECQVQDSPDGTNWTTRGTSGALVGSAIKAGSQAVAKLPSELARYVRANYTVVGTATATVSAAIVVDYNRTRAYPARG